MDFLKTFNLTKKFGNNTALHDVSISLGKGEQYVIQGPSGCGKSTLLYLLGGLDRPTSGEIVVGEKKLSSMSDDELACYRNQSVGFIFQFHFLLPSMTCLQNILLPAKIGNRNLKEVTSSSKDLAKRLGVEHCLEKFPFELSGGEQQRINIIRSLSLRPKLLLCDEPTGNLDSKNSVTVANLLKELGAKYEATLVVVTHDQFIAGMFNHQLKMIDGAFSQSGSSESDLSL